MNRDPYCPPHDVESRIEALSQKLFNLNTSDNSQWKAYHFQNNDEKYKYFLTPVETPDFLYKLTTDSQNNLHKLPSNLNIQLEPIRYNPNEDNFFKANAYPGRSTIVSNLAAAKKHPSYRVIVYLNMTVFFAPRSLKLNLKQQIPSNNELTDEQLLLLHNIFGDLIMKALLIIECGSITIERSKSSQHQLFRCEHNLAIFLAELMGKTKVIYLHDDVICQSMKILYNHDVNTTDNSIEMNK
ncbi:expressed conserved protein [Schistosoma japonicum]|nr:expressed conserved protein [Schistosoma japonicum]